MNRGRGRGGQRGQRDARQTAAYERQQLMDFFGIAGVRTVDELEQGAQYMRQFFQQELNPIPGTKIITYESNLGRGNFDMDGPRVTSISYRELSENMKQVFTTTAGITVRIFTDKTDEKTGLPIKRMRMYIIQPGGQWMRAPIDAVRWAQNTDSRTGRQLTPEPALEYE
ncbi:hypothetical protein MIR68_000907 [Amoeboaphelidium protococcarum]|nr:hypothetical protein MIR68_000907 [Amoeboaphelidium protococcarum]